MLTKLNIEELDKYKEYLFKRKCCSGYIEFFVAVFVNVKDSDEILEIYNLPDTYEENGFNLKSNVLPDKKQEVLLLAQDWSKDKNRSWTVATYEGDNKWRVFLGYTVWHDYIGWVDISKLR